MRYLVVLEHKTVQEGQPHVETHWLDSGASNDDENAWRKAKELYANATDGDILFLRPIRKAVPATHVDVDV